MVIWILLCLMVSLFSYNYEKVTGKMHNSCTICESEKCPYISFSTVNGDFNIKYKN